MMKINIIGLGNKARQGKNYVCNYIKELYPGNVIELSFGRALYSELSNAERKKPLIITEISGNIEVFSILEKDRRKSFAKSRLKYLDKIFQQRKIRVYWGMNEKDPEMLQFWGTDYRRNLYSNDYWVDIIKNEIDNLLEINFDGLFVITDVRFMNEYNFIKNNKGVYVNVVRLKEDGERYLADDRDPNHLSEIELDNVAADFRIAANNKDLAGLREATKVFLETYKLI